MPALVGLWCVAALLALGVAAIGAARTSVGSILVYGGSLVASLLALAVGLTTQRYVMLAWFSWSLFPKAGS